MSSSDFDIDYWIQKIQLRRARPGLLHFNHGPLFVSYAEQLRAAASKRCDLGPSVPCDVFVLSLGEPEDRSVTKIGGLPYRPAGKPWPISAETGEPLIFFAQFNFTKSRDLFPNLPGDILLAFFADFAGQPYDWFPGPPQFEWYSLRIQDLVSPQDVPTPRIRTPLLYGTPYRTRDFLNPMARDAMVKVLKDQFQSRLEDEDARYFAHWAWVWNNLKVGGVPAWTDHDLARHAGVESGLKFLAEIPSIWPYYKKKYSWLNRDRDVPDEEVDFMWVWSEEGAVHVFLREDLSVVPLIQLWSPETEFFYPEEDRED
jgi:hypothetical protein